MFSKSKKPTVQLISLTKTASKAHISLSQAEHYNHSSHKESKGLKKDNSSKQFKLISSASSEFPQLLAKSASQTTIHRKMDDNKLKLLERMGFKKRSEQPVGGSVMKGNVLGVGNFRLGKKLGSGRFGNVYLA